jgi:exopolysaccharide biosynthesis polyprenyl glycosylphosphotransferase
LTARAGTERSLLLLDVGAVIVALVLTGPVRGVLAGWLPGLRPTVPIGEFVHLLLVFLPSWAIGAARLGLARPRTIMGPRVELLRAVVLAQAWGLLALAAILVAAQAPLNRSLIATFLVLSTLLVIASKAAQRRWLTARRGEALALVLGDESSAEQALDWVRERRVERLPEPSADGLRARLQEGGVDEVVLPRTLRTEELRPLLEACEEAGVPALLPMPMLDLLRQPPRAEVVGRTLFLAYVEAETESPARFLKALCDRVVAAAGLVLTLPVLVVAVVAIKLGSRGPVFFVQTRGGLHGRPFRMLKFRTMREGAEDERAALLQQNEMDGPVFKIRHDPRVTRVGRWLRRTSLDELPQLWNVLQGEMSLVGPRPLPIVETRALAGPHRRRLSMRPGITGLWQVSGRNDLGFEAWMALDLQYVDHWSLGLDLAILLRTLPAVLSQKGAR